MAQSAPEGDTSAGPLVSLVMAVRNGMPYLPEAVWSVAAQTYRNLELVVHDGCSTDGTREFLATVRGIPRLSVVSAPDASSAEGFSRALERCRGAIVGTICADDVLEPDAVAWAVAFFEQHPNVAAVYGATTMIDEAGRAGEVYTPPAFDLLRVMSCAVVPPFAASFFSRRVCGSELRFDRSIAHLDFDLWLRLGHLPIVATPQRLARVRVHAGSNTCRLENYDWYCRDKIAIVERYLARYGQSALTEAVFRYAAAGIYAWAAESILILGGDPEQCDPLIAKGLAFDPGSPRLRAIEEHIAAGRQRPARAATPRPAGGATPAPGRSGADVGPPPASTVAASRESDDPWVAQRIALAQQLCEARAWDAAARALSQALDREPMHAQGLYMLGCVELQRGRPAAAAAALREASRLLPGAADVHSVYGAALLAAGCEQEAEVAWRAALALASDRADIWANLAELYARQGRLARAAAAYARAAALAPEDAELREALERVQESAVVVP